MAHPSVILTAAPVIVGARRVGAPLRACAAAAKVPWPTLMRWLRRGRAAIEAAGDGGAVEEDDRPYADLARELDHCAAQYEQVLRSRALRGTEGDARLAWEMVKWLDGERARRAEHKLTKARAAIEEQRAAQQSAPAGGTITLTLPAQLSTPRED